VSFGRADTEYDPWAEDAEARQQERELHEAQREHEAWSRAQARAGKSALNRTDEATWVIPPDLAIGRTTNTEEVAPRG